MGESKVDQENRNTNCLEGIRCPKCKQNKIFHVEGSALFLLNDAGSAPFAGYSHDRESSAVCPNCKYTSIFEDFDETKANWGVKFKRQEVQAELITAARNFRANGDGKRLVKAINEYDKVMNPQGSL